MGRDCSLDARVSHKVSPNTRAPCAEMRENMGGQLHVRVSDDVVFYVGQSRKLYNVSAESLMRSSAYFRNLLSKRRGAGTSLPPVVMDCEESVFEGLLLLMRYGAWEALRPLSHAQAFRLKKEAELYGIHYIEPPPKSADSPAGSSSPGGSPKSPTESARPPPPCRRLSGRLSVDGVRLSGTTSRQLAELSSFPLDLADPTKLLLVSCIDEEKAPIYSCDYCTSSRPAVRSPATATQWALSFHYRHAFCTACGRPPSSSMAPKLFAEMFTGAAAQYSQSAHDPATSCKPVVNWWLGADSTCLLRLVSSPAGGPDACSSATCSTRTTSPPDTVWAATFFYSHAFCTRCGQAAHASALLSVLLALRYGTGSVKFGGRSSFKISSPDGS